MNVTDLKEYMHILGTFAGIAICNLTVYIYKFIRRRRREKRILKLVKNEVDKLRASGMEIEWSGKFEKLNDTSE